VNFGLAVGTEDLFDRGVEDGSYSEGEDADSGGVFATYVSAAASNRPGALIASPRNPRG